MHDMPSVPCVFYDSHLLGRIEHVTCHLQMIRDAIPEKSTLTEEEVRWTLTAAHPWWGTVVAVHRDTVQPLGIIVWYESGGDLYLWLGAVAPEYRRHGLCSYILRYLHQTTDYDRWFTKVGRDNATALYCLTDFGFKPYGTEADGTVVLMEWRCPKTHWRLR